MRSLGPAASLLAAALVLLLWSGCGDDSESNNNTNNNNTNNNNNNASADGGVDQALPDIGKLPPDLGALPDLPQKDPCDSEWKTAISPQATSSTGKVTTTALSGGGYRTAVDATAGGMSGAHNNPYVYISFKDGKRVDIDDYTAKKSTSWDLALRRSVIRINGGDSGAGQGGIAIVPGKTLSEVTTVPASSAFAVDDFLDASCTIKKDPIGNIATAIGGADAMWYTYSTGSMKLTPNKEVYIIRRGDASGYVKLVIEGYYDTTGAGANYTLAWDHLK